MRSDMQKIRLIVKRLLARFPAALPSGMTSMDEFIESILSTYNLPNTPSYHRMIAMMIQHMPQSRYRASKFEFYKAIMRALANEAAFHKLQALKEAEATALKQADTPDVELFDGPKDPPGPPA